MVGRGEKTYFAAPAQALLGGTSCWDNRPPKRGKFEGEPLGACLESGERAFIPWQERSAAVEGEKKLASVWQE